MAIERQEMVEDGHQGREEAADGHREISRGCK